MMPKNKSKTDLDKVCFPLLTPELTAKLAAITYTNCQVKSTD